MNLTIFEDIQFNHKDHTYTLKDKNLIPITALVSKLEREVDWAEKAKGVSIKTGVSVDLIRKQWSDKREKAADKGKLIHKYIERRLKYNSERDSLYPEMEGFDCFWAQAQQKMKLVKAEMIIGDYDLGVGGTIDTLFYSKNTNKFHIFDWKSNEKFSHNNSWQTLLKPFEDLEDCHLIKYSLQLSAYKLVLKRNTDLNLGESYIVWLNSDYLNHNYQSFKCFDYVDRLEKWILGLV